MNLTMPTYHAIVKVEVLGTDLGGKYYNRVTCSCGKEVVDEDNAVLDWMESHLQETPGRIQQENLANLLHANYEKSRHPRIDEATANALNESPQKFADDVVDEVLMESKGVTINLEDLALHHLDHFVESAEGWFWHCECGAVSEAQINRGATRENHEHHRITSQ